MFNRLKRIHLLLSVLSLLFLFSNAAADNTGPNEVKEIEKGTVTGRIMVKDRKDVPLAWGEIMFYDLTSGPPPAPSKYERTPDVSKNMDADGNFKFLLPAGRYYMGAIKRLSGDRLGPPQVGDYIFRSIDEKGQLKEYLIEAGKTLDLGTFSEAFPLKKEDIAKDAATTAIVGTVIDMEGNPVKDVVVVAFLQPALEKKPIFVSNKTDKDGKYILPLAEGVYYLRVRNSFAAGPPQPGQIVGYYGEGKPAPIKVKKNEIIKGADFQVIMFPGRGPFTATPQDSPNDK